MSNTPVYKATNAEEQMQAQVRVTESGVDVYAVTLVDLDSGLALPTVYKFNRLDDAMRKADALVGGNPFVKGQQVLVNGGRYGVVAEVTYAEVKVVFYSPTPADPVAALPGNQVVEWVRRENVSPVK